MKTELKELLRFVRRPEIARELKQADEQAQVDEVLNECQLAVAAEQQLDVDAAQNVGVLKRELADLDGRVAAHWADHLALRGQRDAAQDTLVSESFRIERERDRLRAIRRKHADMPTIERFINDLEGEVNGMRKVAPRSEERNTGEYFKSTGAAVVHVFSETPSFERRVLAIRQAIGTAMNVIPYEVHTPASLAARLQGVRDALPAVVLENVAERAAA